MSGLICGENSNPLAAYVMMSMNPVVHVAAWPAFFSPAQAMADSIMAVTRGLAYSMGCFIVNATGVVDNATIEAYEPGPEEREFLERVKGRSHASVIAPNGQVVAGPLDGGEGILYADVDLNDVLVPKLIHDFTSHYNRFDIFSLQVNTDAPPAVAFVGADAAARMPGIEKNAAGQATPSSEG